MEESEDPHPLPCLPGLVQPALTNGLSLTSPAVFQTELPQGGAA